MTKELTISDLVPCGIYNLQTLVNFKVLEKSTAEKLSRQINKDKIRLFEYPVDSDLVDRLNQAGIQVPEDKVEIFGVNFSKIVEYNAALQRPILTKEDGASDKFRKVLDRWHEVLKPWEKIKAYHEYRAERGYRFDDIIGAYIRKQIEAGKTTEEAAPELGDLLEETADLIKKSDVELSLRKFSYYFHTCLEGAFGELFLLAYNAELIFEAYRRVSNFRNKFRDQISALVKLYSGNEWGEKTQEYAHRIEQFLQKPPTINS